MRTRDDLKQMQALPLSLKVSLTKSRIREWINKFGEENVYISFSGGKDSTVLLHLVREDYPDVKAVFVNTGLEYPEIQKFAQSFDNVDAIRPEMRFDEVIRKYGYPIIGKEVAKNVYYARRRDTSSYRKKLAGTWADSNGELSQFNCEKYEPLLYVDFIISEECCRVMKKNPIKRHYKGKYGITAQMAEESMLRMRKWIQHGCNMFDIKQPKSNPMSFWTEQDVLEYIKLNNIPICSVYGDIIETNGEAINGEQLCFEGCGKYRTTGCHRTGCIFCGYGAHLEKGETRFQRLKRTHPRQYEYCIGGGAYDSDGLWKPDKNGLGMAHVFDEVNKIYGENFIRYK